MSEGQPDHPVYPRARKKTSVEELIRAKRPHPIQSMDELAVPGLWESDEELDEFLAFTYAERHRDLG